jgi:hypothetical protein
MGLLAKDKGGSDIAPCPTGMHHGICYGVVDVGTQPAYGRFPARRKVVLLFEFPDIRIELPDKQDPKKKLNLPRALSIKETLTLASKGNLRPILEGWRGRAFTEQELEGFDLAKVIGANALINVIHETKADKTYANIKSVNPLPAGMAKKKAETPALYFSFDDIKKGTSFQLPENMPQWLQGLILQSEECASHSKPNHAPQNQQAHTDENLDEDVPF